MDSFILRWRMDLQAPIYGAKTTLHPKLQTPSTFHLLNIVDKIQRQFSPYKSNI